MDRLRLLQGLRAQVAEAVEARDWAALSAAERIMAKNSAVIAAGNYGPDERSALDALRHARMQAQAMCGQELQRLAALMNEMRESREGWLAYACDSEMEEGKA